MFRNSRVRREVKYNIYTARCGILETRGQASMFEGFISHFGWIINMCLILGGLPYGECTPVVRENCVND